MRQPMFRWRMFRHGAHQVNIRFVFGMELTRNVDRMTVEQRLEELALLGPLSDDPGLALLRMQVDVCTRHVEVAAHDQFAPRFVHAS